jgi:kynureninase
VTARAAAPPDPDPTTLAYAEALDRADPLAAFRERFVEPDPGLIYLDGNSLGRLPKATADRLAHVVQHGWGDRLIRSWDEGWLDLPQQVGDLIGVELLGARAGEVVVGDSTTVNLYKLVAAALDARPRRHVVVTDRENFPTDRYVLEGLAARGDIEIRWLDSDPVAGPQPADVEAALGDDVALVTLSHVAYRTAALADLPAITALAHAAGALTLWDLSHSGGSVPVDLAVANADLAVGCTYKYMNSGPGSPAYLYVRRDLIEQLNSPIAGWWAQRDMFAMMRPFDPQPDIRRFLAGTAPVLAIVAVEEGARVLAEAGISALRTKGQALTTYAVDLLDAWLAPLGFGLASPRDPARRGSHITVAHPDSETLCAALIASGVVPDFRHPDGIRLGMAPLTTRFTDVYHGVAAIRALVT